ncbi:MAG: hypothetical protein K0M64_11650 [Rhizobium sp.]|nr:hypothetical protein [Rhizobium sp.]
MKHPVLTLMALAIAIAAPGAVKAQSAQQLQEKEAALQASRAKAGSARLAIAPKDLVAYAGTTAGGPTWTRPFGSTVAPYSVQVMSVSQSDTCEIYSSMPTYDGYLLLYRDAFDPLAPTSNLVALNDDYLTVTQSLIPSIGLEAGTTYYVVNGAYTSGSGAFDTQINCPVANVRLTPARFELANPASNIPVRVAEELVIPPSRTLANAGRLDINTEVGYAFSPGEVRYARLHCPGVQFAPGTAVAFTGDASNLIGSVNGIGSDAIYFSITAGATPVVATDLLTVAGDRTVIAKGPVDCTYGLYDFPSQAQAGGTAGRLATTGGAYLRFVPSYVLHVDSQGNPVADVESAEPAYSEFTDLAPTWETTLGNIGGFSYGTRQQVLGGSQPITLDGEAVELADLMGGDTTLVFTGDFSAAGRVFITPDEECDFDMQQADSFDASEAVFTIGSNAYVDHYLCYETGGEAIRASNFTVALAPVSADATTYGVAGRGPLDLGRITRNGTELQAPLAQVPSNYLSRMVLTNTGSLDRPYVIQVFGETGNVISTANLTGTVPARGTLVVDLSDVLTGFTAAPRATLNVTVSAPNNQIQGLYQVVNPDSGTISNHVMVRPEVAEEMEEPLPPEEV